MGVLKVVPVNTHVDGLRYHILKERLIEVMIRFGFRSHFG